MTGAEAIHPDLKEASVFVTGGASGIGAALVEGFLRQGARVAFFDRADATGTVEAMEARTGNRPLFIKGDVTDTPALMAAIDSAATTHGPVTVLVSNAANDTRFDAQDLTEAEWDACLDVNLKPYFFAAQKVAPMMEAAGGGAIVNMSSGSYLMGVARLAPYVASNAAIMGMTRSLAREWGPRGIRVNAIAPGWVMTERQKDLWATPEAQERHRAQQCLPELMQAEDLVGGVLFLASKASRMVTSQMLVIDAGVSMTG
ncbi:SDR family NAD(P)-dependent oxidoreductase [Limimaricola cinnabarinus]|uniref:SDR family NAD(P)-dependent oxidoreductase n=1 Tax=Limimaricola cinnabarinus TaxID=1125964 RepID=UPI0024923318|nr:SDR family oxidoreductase [Limimaricola cinnabarinus]